MPVAFRPESAVSVEAVMQMSDSIKKMEQQLIEREQRLVKKEQRVKLLFDDLATEQDELRAFSEGIDAKVEMLQRMTNSLKTILDDLDARKAELKDLEKKTGSDEQSKREELDSKVNDVKSWFENLEAEQAADYLKEFANNGKLEFAASLLQKMSDRQKSKILGVMSDPILVDQLIDSLSIRPKTK
jgi:chromosome segregation ATPase